MLGWGEPGHFEPQSPSLINTARIVYAVKHRCDRWPSLSLAAQKSVSLQISAKDKRSEWLSRHEIQQDESHPADFVRAV